MLYSWWSRYWFFRSWKSSPFAGLLSSLPLAIDYEVLFSDVPWSGYAKIIRHCMKRGIWTPFSLSAYQHLLGTERYLGAGQCLQELGRERTIAMSLPEFEQSCLWQRNPTICYWRPRRATVILQSTPSTAVGCSSSPVWRKQQKKLEVPFTLLWHKRNSHNRRSSGYEKPLKIFTRRWHNQSYETRPYFTIKCKKLVINLLNRTFSRFSLSIIPVNDYSWFIMDH